MKLLRLLSWMLIGACLGDVQASLAGDKQRTKVIDFESNLVEGINRRPYDSLNQLGDARKKKGRPHLYRKRSGFSSDTRETLSEARWLQ